MSSDEKSSRRQQCILQAVADALAECEYHQLTIEDVAARAGVGKSTIYRWWKHKSELVWTLSNSIQLRYLSWIPLKA